MSAPTPNHQEVLFEITLQIGNFVKRNKLGKVYFAPVDVQLDERNIIQPDLLFINIKRKGIVRNVIHGAPDFIIEVLSINNEARDRNHKLPLFGKHGVEECWLISLKAEEVEVYHNKNNEMQLTQKAQKHDTVKSLAINGFEMEVSRIFES